MGEYQMVNFNGRPSAIGYQHQAGNQDQVNYLRKDGEN
jgi:hypothetical protein